MKKLRLLSLIVVLTPGEFKTRHSISLIPFSNNCSRTALLIG